MFVDRARLFAQGGAGKEEQGRLLSVLDIRPPFFQVLRVIIGREFDVLENRPIAAEAALSAEGVG